MLLFFELSFQIHFKTVLIRLCFNYIKGKAEMTLQSFPASEHN